ncbi:Integrase core domain protein [Xanthomonas sp. GW]|nr:Integrase core domain protein [Xanthomonas sp. GW]
MAWLQARGIKHILIQPGKPTQNAYIESFNGRFRDECLNENCFETLAQAREVIALWRQDYNEVRPHGSIGRIPPAAFAARHREPSTIDAGSVNLQNPGPLSHWLVRLLGAGHGEQIDGAVKFEGEHYLIEAKWQERSASNEPVYQFAGKVAGKPYGRGLFISVNDLSPGVIRGLVMGKEIQTLFVDGEDLILVLEGHLSLREIIDRKVKAAQTRGLIYVHPISGIEKKL